MTRTYFITDHLGTPRFGYNDKKVQTWRWASDGFGNQAPNTDVGGDGKQIHFNFRMPGQYYDAESGLFYNWNRYYDAGMGRYVTSDPIGLGGGLNTYGYVGGNPLVRFDSKGLKVELRCRRLGNPNNPSFKSGVATFLGGQHCFINLSCKKGGIPETTISYLGSGVNIASDKDNNNDTVYSDKGRFIPIPVIRPPEDCGEECAFERCLLSKAGGIDAAKRIKDYSIFGPNSNTFVQNLITSCGGKVKDFFGKPYGWDHGDFEYE